MTLRESSEVELQFIHHPPHVKAPTAEALGPALLNIATFLFSFYKHPRHLCREPGFALVSGDTSLNKSRSSHLLSSSSDVYYSFFQVPFPSGLWVGSSNGRNWLKIGVWEEREARIYFVFFLSLFPMASLLTATFSHGSVSTGQGPTILLDILGSWTLVKISTSHCHTSFGMKAATRCCSVQWPLCPLFGICRTEIIMLAPQE